MPVITRSQSRQSSDYSEPKFQVRLGWFKLLIGAVATVVLTKLGRNMQEGVVLNSLHGRISTPSSHGDDSKFRNFDIECVQISAEGYCQAFAIKR